VDRDAARRGAPDGIENVKVAPWHHRAVLEVKVEDVAHEEELATGGKTIQKAHKSLPPLTFAACARIVEVSVSHYSDIGRMQDERAVASVFHT
jgi:hypothetical protein